MNTDYRNIPVEQKAIAVQRLTALWAFTESGLGGIMHAFKIPFTGLLVGGMALVMISLIASIAGHPYKQVLKSAVIVLIVKAMVSPHTPPAAYMAVSFQALLGYGLFRMMGVNMISILFLSVVSMIESAVQKVIILTLFLGQSLWKAMDALVGYVAGQLGFATSNGSYWVIGIYMLIYIAGGFVVAWLAYRSIQRFRVIQEEEIIFHRYGSGTQYRGKKKNLPEIMDSDHRCAFTFPGTVCICAREQAGLAGSRPVNQLDGFCHLHLVRISWPLAYQAYPASAGKKER